MRHGLTASLIILAGFCPSAFAQCAPAPDSPYFFRNLSQQRAEAKLADNRKFFEQLLSETFSTRARDGKTIGRNGFIDNELAAARASQQKQFFAIREFSLVEHQRDFVVASYLLTEGTTGGGETRASETWLRETYRVEDGHWRLTAVEPAPARTAYHPQ